MENVKKLTLLLAASLIMVSGATAQSDRPSTQVEVSFMSADPYPVMSGEDADIRLVVSNEGNTEAENVEISLLDSFPFEVKPDRKQNYTFNRIVPGQEYYISTEVLVDSEAPDGMNDFKVKITQGDFSKTQDVPIEVEDTDVDLNVANLKTSPGDLKPDTENAELTVDVVNNGEKKAENVIAEVGLPYGFESVSSLSTRQAIGNLAAGETKSATFRFDINESASMGTESFPLNISYSDSGSDIQNEQVQGDFELYISGSPRFQVEAAESGLTAGEKEEVRVRVTNTGEVDSESTRVRVLDNADQPFSYSSKSSFVGTLNPNSSGTAVFTVSADSSAPEKSYILEFETRGVSEDQVFVENHVVRATVEKPSQGSNSVLPAALGVLAVAAGLIYFFRERIWKILDF